MALTQPNFYFPHLPPPPSHPFNPPPSPFHPFNPSFKSPPPPSHSFPPPPHGQPPPPPPHRSPPIPPPPRGHPPPPSHHSPPPPHVRPPSPHHPIAPPPPHLFPPPPQFPPSPSPYHPTVIIIVIISLGGVALLSMLAFALFCCIQKRKKKNKETDIVHIDEHKKVTETIVPGPFGQKATVITVEDDVHIDEQIRKKETPGHNHGLHAQSSKADVDDQGNSSSAIEGKTTSPGRDYHHPTSTT